MAGEGEIKVDTKAFITASEEIATAQKQVAQAFESFIGEINNLRSSWQGDTSDKVKAIANSMKNSAATIDSHMYSYCNTLNELAGVYDQHEKQAEEQTRALGFDIGDIR